MKKSTEVLGLKVIGIKEGTDKGVIQDIIIDPAAKKVSHLILKDSRGYGFYGLSINDVLGFGADYATTPTIGNVRKLYESKELLEVIENGFYLLGATVLSSGGDIIGAVKDFAFSPKSGALEKLMLDNGAEYQADKIGALAGNTVFLELAEPETEPEAVSVAQPAEEKDGIEQDSIRFLLNKTVKATVVSDDGEFIAEAGTRLTEELLREAGEHDALLSLTLNV